MRPIDEFVYVGNQVIVPDQASLMRCYYPLLGVRDTHSISILWLSMIMVIIVINLLLF